MANYKIILTADTIADLREQLLARLRELDATITLPSKPEILNTKLTCRCGRPAIEKRGIGKKGKPYHGIYCTIYDHVDWL